MSGSDRGIVSFGPFRLSPATRTLERDGIAIALGDRALDILIALVEHAGQIVSQKELMSRVWRDLVVSPGNLRVHMAALRKALDAADSGASYIENVVGQGYCFVAPVTRVGTPAIVLEVPRAFPSVVPRPLPLALNRMVGRDETVRTIAADLRTDRFVTIVGAGGMGKTTVAVSVAHAMKDEFGGSVCFVDFGAITDASLLPTTVASTLGLASQSVDALTTLMAFLQNARLLLVLDNCEHVIDAAASLAEVICSQAPQVHILTTSREALRVEGEHAHWLRPLESPPPEISLSAEAALEFPAIKLFVERATASDSRFRLTDENASMVADICRRLDGIALALEFVAGRIATYGLEGTVDLLEKRLGLHWQGRRTALPRHKTLYALLDWSYGLLPPFEQRVLRGLSIFVGPFTLEAAQATLPEADQDIAAIAIALDSLIAKSLVATYRAPEGTTHYRLLETTRIHASERLEQMNDIDAVAERHARYFAELLGSRPPQFNHEHLGNLRAALDWCFSDRPGASIPARIETGIDLAAASVATLLHFSLWNECHSWSKAALARLTQASHIDKKELVLQEALAIASMYTGAPGLHAVIVRGIEMARELAETAVLLRLLASLHFYSHRVTDFRASLAISEEIETVARSTDDVIAWAIADWLRGSSQYCLGNQQTALQLFERGFTHGGDHYAADAQQLGIYYRSRGLIGLARVRWLCGYPDQALQTAKQALEESAATSAANRSYALLVVCHVFLWRGDLDTALEVIGRVLAQPHWQGRLVWFHTEALALKGEVLIRRGNLAEGIELISSALADMKTKNQKNLMLTVTACALAEGLGAAGQVEEGLAVITDVLTHAPGNAETWEAPELLRVRASLLMATTQPEEIEAERCLTRSLELSRQQKARGWELRAATTLAQLKSRQGLVEEACDILATVYAQFTEGFDTRDLRTARELLNQFGSALAASAARSADLQRRADPSLP